MKPWQWRGDNKVQLLENGEAYYPAVFAAIRAASVEVLIETFILFEDKVGLELEANLAIAARRGAHIELTVDGYGSEKLSPAFIERMQKLGVLLRMFEPYPRLFGNRVNLFRRLHRKIVVVDGHTAFVGGINFSEDHMANSGEKSKQDYAVKINGPLVEDLHRLIATPNDERVRRGWWQRWQHPALPVSAADLPPMRALLATRDNHQHFDDIERLYRIAIRSARQRIVIANAYFFPGYRLMRALRQAARRGVSVQLLMQGNPDMPVMRFITQTLYASLARAGVEIFEYQARPLHAKVAVIDGEWATVGSSNLDPLSLALNLEANIFIADKGFATELGNDLDALLRDSSQRLDRESLKKPSPLGLVLGYLAFHVSRYFPVLARRLPAHAPRSQVLAVPHKPARQVSR